MVYFVKKIVFLIEKLSIGILLSGVIGISNLELGSMGSIPSQSGHCGVPLKKVIFPRQVLVVAMM